LFQTLSLFHVISPVAVPEAIVPEPAAGTLLFAAGEVVLLHVSCSLLQTAANRRSRLRVQISYPDDILQIPIVFAADVRNMRERERGAGPIDRLPFVLRICSKQRSIFLYT